MRRWKEEEDEDAGNEEQVEEAEEGGGGEEVVTKMMRTKLSLRWIRKKDGEKKMEGRGRGGRGGKEGLRIMDRN